MVPSSHLCFFHAKQHLVDQNYNSVLVPDLTCRLCLQNSMISTRITSLQGSHTSPVVLCMQNNVISIRITSLCFPAFICGFRIQNSDFSNRIASLYGSQSSSVVFAFKTAAFGSKLQVSMSPRPHLSFCACKTV